MVTSNKVKATFAVFLNAQVSRNSKDRPSSPKNENYVCLNVT